MRIPPDGISPRANAAAGYGEYEKYGNDFGDWKVPQEFTGVNHITRTKH
jgi:hypothetical protein